MPETGGNVTFTYVVTNNSAEAATITALTDDKFGTLAGDADCQVGTVLAAGGSCAFQATFAIPAGDYPGSHTEHLHRHGHRRRRQQRHRHRRRDGHLHRRPARHHGDQDRRPDLGARDGRQRHLHLRGDEQQHRGGHHHGAERRQVRHAGRRRRLPGRHGAGRQAHCCAFQATFAIPAGDFPGSHVNIFTATVADDDGNSDTRHRRRDGDLHRRPARHHGDQDGEPDRPCRRPAAMSPSPTW